MKFLQDLRVLLVPLEYFFSNFEVHSLVKERPCTVIQRVTISRSNSRQYFSYLIGILWAISSQSSKTGFELSVVARMSPRWFVSAATACTQGTFRWCRTIISIASIRWNTWIIKIISISNSMVLSVNPNKHEYVCDVVVYSILVYSKFLSLTSYMLPLC